MGQALPAIRADKEPAVRTLLLHAAVLVVAVVAFGLRVYRAGAQSFWYDEGISVSLAHRGLLDITHDAAADIHPPVYYYILHFWINLAGDSEFAVRFVSAAAGVVAACLVYRLGVRLLSPAAGLVAALFVACTPLLVYYGQEARMYSVLLALTTLWALVWLRLLKADGKLKSGAGLASWAAYVGLGVASVYTHYFAFLLLPVHVVATVVAHVRRPRLLAKWLVAQAAVAFAFVPWFLSMSFGQLESFQRGQTPLGPAETTLKMFDDLTIGHFAVPDEQARVAFAALLVVGLLSPLLARPRERWGSAYALLYLCLPLAAMLVLNSLRSAYQPRLVLLATPGLYLLFGQGIAGLGGLVGRVGTGGRMAGTTALLVGATALAYVIWPLAGSLEALYYDERWQRDDYRGAISHIERNAESGDAIVMDSPYQTDVFGLYYKGDLPYYPLPAQVPIDEAQTEADLQEIVRRHEGIWAILWGFQETDPDSFVERWLDANAFKAQDSWFGGVRLAHYLVAPVGERVPLDLRFGEDIRLRGYAWQKREGSPGEVLPLILYWEAVEPIDKPYKVFVHVLDEQEQIWGQRDSEPAGGASPTTSWRPGQEVEDRLGVPLDAGIKPGRYQVEIGMYHYPSMERPSVFDAEGRDLGNRVLIGPVEVK